MKKDKEQQKKGNWKEYIYNSPYLIIIILTSAAVMFFSDEIGIRAAAKEVRVFAEETYAKMPKRQEQTLTQSAEEDLSAEELSAAEEKAMAEQGGSVDVSGEFSGDSVDKLENAGECRKDEDGIVDSSELSDEAVEAENTENTEEMPKGKTNYEFYEPVSIESYYYSDAGKVALTTEYPYTYENMSYFNDAAFLGDSRTLGISDYAGLEETDFYCDSGMTIFKLLEEEITYQRTGNKVKLAEVLQEKQYGKIYIMLGMNELGYGNTHMYLEKYREVLQQIRQWQPDAVLYIMANLHVSREKNNPATEFNNININDKNAAAASLANGTDIFYLDANPLFTDGEGFLQAELTFDGVHLYAQHYDVWREFLLEHAVEPEDVWHEEQTEAEGVDVGPPNT